MGENTLVAEPRSGTGKGLARKLRAAGRIPAVMYGRAREPRPLSVDAREFESLLQRSGAGMNTLIDLQVDGNERVVLVKELQREPVYGSFVHADFYLLDLEKKVDVEVPLSFVGKAAGEDMGGVVDHPLREVELQCLPRVIPESVEVDVSALEIGDSIHVRDLVLPQGVEMKTDLDLAVATCMAPRVIEEEVTAEEGAEAEAAEPTTETSAEEENS